MSTFAEILSHLMQAQKLSSSELARRTGVAQPIIYRLMNGNTCNPQILTVKPIADYFAISIDQLLGFSPLDLNPSLSALAVHDINNRLQTIKITGSALVDIFPILEKSYHLALNAKLLDNELSMQIFPLLQLSIDNLEKLSDEIFTILSANTANKKDTL